MRGRDGEKLTFFQLFGKDFNIKLLVDVIIEVKPSGVTMGSHHFQQMAELGYLDKVEPVKLESVKLLLPSGSSVPPCCIETLKRKFPNLMGIGNFYGLTELGKCNQSHQTYQRHQSSKSSNLSRGKSVLESWVTTFLPN